MGVAHGGFKARHHEKAGSASALTIKIKNFGTVTETQVGYRVTATCSGTCTGTVTLSAACTGTVGPLAPGNTKAVSGCTATPTTAGDHWLYTLIVIHCGTDGAPPCTSNDGGTDANPANNIRVRKVKVA